MSGNRLDAWSDSAREYDAFEKKWNFYGTVADAMIGRLEIVRDSRVLELACGTGACTLRLAEIAREGGVVALDYSAGMLDVARENAAAGGFSNISFVQGDAGEVASLLAGQSFDFAVCNSAFWHFTDPDRVLAGIRELLAGNGVFALSLPFWVEGNGEAREALRAKVRELLLERGVSQQLIDSMRSRGGRLEGGTADLLRRHGFASREVHFDFEVSKESRADWRRISIFSAARRRNWSLPGLDPASQAEVWDEVEAWRRSNILRDPGVSRWMIWVSRKLEEPHAP